MNIGQINNAMIGFSIFDAWEASMKQVQKTRMAMGGGGSPLVQAAFDAFDNYAQTVETKNAAMVQSLSTTLNSYVMNAQGTGAKLISQSGQAPLLAAALLA